MNYAQLKEKGYAVNLVNKTLLEAFAIMDHFNAYDYMGKIARTAEKVKQ